MPIVLRSASDRKQRGFAADHAAGDQVAVPPDILGERVQRHVGAVLDRLLEHRSQKRVVDHDQRLVRGIVRVQFVAQAHDAGDVDEFVRRVRRAFEVDHRDAAFCARRFDQRANVRKRRARREVRELDAEPAEHRVDQFFGGRVQRAGVKDHLAGAHVREQRGADRRHAGGEHGRFLGAFPQCESVFEDLLVGSVEAAVDQAFGAAGTFAGDALEEAFAVGAAVEHERRGQEDRRLQRAFARAWGRSRNPSSATAATS